MIDYFSYYNDTNKFVTLWLRNLQNAGLISRGTIDERPIQEVKVSDLAPTSHFFAGIGGWDYALRLAGWSPERPVWTGSCPCQPFSVAGKRRGISDERHLWPEWFRLIKECRPPTIFGEQVASKAGREWFTGVRSDLETLGYAVGAADLCAAGVGAPHQRQRLFFVADSSKERWVRRNVVPNFDREKGTRRTSSFWCSDRKVLEVRETGRTILGEWCPRPRFIQMPNGIPGQVEQLRAYGNSIVPQLAAEFVCAFVEINA